MDDDDDDRNGMGLYPLILQFQTSLLYQPLMIRVMKDQYVALLE